MRKLTRTMFIALLAFAAFVIPVGIGEGTFGTSVADAATWRAYTKCQLVQIKPNTVVGYVEGRGTASNENDARSASLAEANANVPPGHYKRHCQTTSTDRRVGGGRF